MSRTQARASVTTGSVSGSARPAWATANSRTHALGAPRGAPGFDGVQRHSIALDEATTTARDGGTNLLATRGRHAPKAQALGRRRRGDAEMTATRTTCGPRRRSNATRTERREPRAREAEDSQGARLTIGELQRSRANHLPRDRSSWSTSNVASVPGERPRGKPCLAARELVTERAAGMGERVRLEHGARTLFNDVLQRSLHEPAMVSREVARSIEDVPA